jgi:hypothetical protein
MSDGTISERIAIIERHLDDARIRMRLEAQGLAVRYYDVATDTFIWRHGSQRWPSEHFNKLRFPPAIHDADVVCMPLSILGESTDSGTTNAQEIDFGQAKLEWYKARLAAGEEFV